MNTRNTPHTSGSISSPALMILALALLCLTGGWLQAAATEISAADMEAQAGPMLAQDIENEFYLPMAPIVLSDEAPAPSNKAPEEAAVLKQILPANPQCSIQKHRANKGSLAFLETQECM